MIRIKRSQLLEQTVHLINYYTCNWPTSMHVVSEDLRLQRLWVVYPGERTYPLSDKIDVIPLGEIQHVLEEHQLTGK